MSRLKPFDNSTLIAHRVAVQRTTTLEAATDLARTGGVDYLCVCDGETVVGLCSAMTINHRLSARFGHAIYAKQPVDRFMVDEPVIVDISTPLDTMLSQVFARKKTIFLRRYHFG